MHRQVKVLLASALMACGATSVAMACVIATNQDCCSLAGVTLNTTRVCGLFNDQECPDVATSNVGNVPGTIPAVSGSMSSAMGQSFACQYKSGRCRGSLGTNLCAYTQQSISCTSSTPSGGACPPPANQEPGEPVTIHDRAEEESGQTAEESDPNGIVHP